MKSPLKRRASIQAARKSSFYSAGPLCRSRSTLSFEKLEATLADSGKLEKLEQRMKEPGLLSPGWNEAGYRPGDLASRSTPHRRIQPKSLFARLKSPSPNKNKSRVCLSFDSPSKNTRARSLFLSPERDIYKPLNLNPPPMVMNTPQKENANTPIKRIEFSTPIRGTPRKQDTRETGSLKELNHGNNSPHTFERQGSTGFLLSPEKFATPTRSTPRKHNKETSSKEVNDPKISPRPIDRQPIGPAGVLLSPNKFSTPTRSTPRRLHAKETTAAKEVTHANISPQPTERQAKGPAGFLLSPKKFSPLTAKGLMTLMESPLLEDGKKQVREEKRTPKSKKMLYH